MSLFSHLNKALTEQSDSDETESRGEKQEGDDSGLHTGSETIQYDCLDLLEHPADGSCLVLFDGFRGSTEEEISRDVRRKLIDKFYEEEINPLSTPAWIDWRGLSNGNTFIDPAMPKAKASVTQLKRDLLSDVFASSLNDYSRTIDVFWKQDADQMRDLRAPVYRMRSYTVTPSLLYARLQPKEIITHRAGKGEHRFASQAIIYDGMAGGKVPEILSWKVQGKTTIHKDLLEICRSAFKDFDWSCGFVRVSSNTDKSDQRLSSLVRPKIWRQLGIDTPTMVTINPSRADPLDDRQRPSGRFLARKVQSKAESSRPLQVSTGAQPASLASSQPSKSSKHRKAPSVAASSHTQSSAGPKQAPGKRKDVKGRNKKVAPVAKSAVSDSDSDEDEWTYTSGANLNEMDLSFPDANRFSSLGDDMLPSKEDFYNGADFLMHPDDGSAMLCYEFSIVNEPSDEPSLRLALAWKFIREEVLSLPNTKWVDWRTDHHSGSTIIMPEDGVDSVHVEQLAEMLAQFAFASIWQDQDRQPSIQIFFQRGLDMAPPKGSKVVIAPVYRLRSFAVTPALLYRRHLPYTARAAHNDRLQRSEEALQTLPHYDSRRPRAMKVIDHMPEARQREEREARYYHPNSGHPRVSRLMIFEGLAGGLIPDLTLAQSTKQDRHEDFHDLGIEHEYNLHEIFYDTFGQDVELHWIRVSKDTSDKSSGKDTRLTTMLSQARADGPPHLFIVTKYAAVPSSPIGMAEQRDPGRFGDVPLGVSLTNELAKETRAFSTASKKSRGGMRGRGRGRRA